MLSSKISSIFSSLLSEINQISYLMGNIKTSVAEWFFQDAASQTEFALSQQRQLSLVEQSLPEISCRSYQEVIGEYIENCENQSSDYCTEPNQLDLKPRPWVLM